MKNRCQFLSLIFASAFILSALLQMNVFCYFSSTVKTETKIGTATLQVAIEDLKVGSIEIAATEEAAYSEIIEINTSRNFSFTITNSGSVDIDYILDLQIYWNSELSEAGKFFVYPIEISDSEIYERLKRLDYSQALIDASVSDQKQITGSAGTVLGISETIDFQTLNTPAASASGHNSKNYAFKLFFFANNEITVNLDLYNNQALEVGISAHADICGRKTGWASIERRSFRLKSIIDTTPPVITGLAKPKTFFVTQTGSLELSSYAAAYDETDGDITGRIEITSYPEFRRDKAGTYKITYHVVNNRGVPAEPLQITIVIWDFVKIVSGNYHSLALTSHGTVYSWGSNAYGELGLGTNYSESQPRLTGLNDITDIDAAGSSSFALDKNGQIYSWGNNQYGQLGDGTSSAQNKPVKAVQPDGVSFVKISAGIETTAALTDEGDVYTWGNGENGALGNGSTANANVPSKINLSGIAGISIDIFHGAAVSKDGVLYTWGTNGYGNLGCENQSGIFLPSPVQYFADRNIRIAQVSAGWLHMAAISEDGRLYTWGYGGYGALGNGTISAPDFPEHIPLPAGAEKIIAGFDYTGVITTDGRVCFFGQNDYGKHGNGDESEHLSPVFLQDINDATHISLGLYSSFVLTSHTTVYGMGYGKSGVLGTGNNNNSNVPVKWAFTPPQPS